ncbi:MAG: hypothetical protein HYY26_06230 [Acidobacteria bacterium]|nr:hypothetical protein [Acidobacteriota bacterium]
MRVRVECHAGHRADQRPLRFYLAERRFEVVDVLDQWYGPEDFYVRVRADDGNIYILRHSHDPNQDFWTLESFRRATVAS